MITDWAQRHDKYEAMRVIGAAGVPVGAVLDTGDLLADTELCGAALSRLCSTPSGESRTRSMARRLSPRCPRQQWL